MNYRTRGPLPHVCPIVVALLCCCAFGSRPAIGQPLPSAPQPAKTDPGAGAYNNHWRAGAVCGTGASHSRVATKPTAQCGVMFTFIPEVEFEFGIMGPQANRSPLSAYVSVNGTVPLAHMNKRVGAPVLVGGYTRMFETGHALDFGLGFAHPLDVLRSVQFEVRDYWAMANPDQHNIVFRVFWLSQATD